jgi:uncharacterized protein (TIGR03437 family)
LRIRWIALAPVAFWGAGQCQQPPPAITPGSIVNAASLMPGSLPGGVLPRGGLVAVYGPRLRADTVTIRANDRTFAAVQVFQSDEYLTALLPGDLPAGDALLSLTHQGQRSVDHPVQIANYAPGLFAVRSPAFSCAEAQPFLDRRETIPRPSAFAPGAEAVLIATGASPASQLLLAGQRVPLSTMADCQPGLQRFRFTIPAKLPPGCNLPLMVTAPDSTTSNYLTLPVKPCTPADTWLARAAASPDPLGFVLMVRSALRLEGKGKSAKDNFFDALLANFGARMGPPDHPDFIWPPAGQCVSFSGTSAVAALINEETVENAARLEVEDFLTTIPRGPKFSLEYPMLENRDAGKELKVNGRSIPRHPKHQRFYYAPLGGNPPVKIIKPSPRYWTAGKYQMTGEGGADIGPFSLDVPFPDEPVWTNRDRIDSIDRTRGVTLEWRGAGAAFILATGIDNLDGGSTLCLCVAPPKARSFTIPPAALANLPSTLIPGSYYSLLGIAFAPETEPPHVKTKGVGAIYAVPLSIVSKSVAIP